MKTVISVASALACAISLDAQITTALNRLPDGSTEIGIRNNSAVSLAAFAISVNVISVSGPTRTATAKNPPLVVYYDPAIDPTTQPLPPNQERTLPPAKILCPAPMRNPTQALAEEGRPGCEPEEAIGTAGNLR